MTSRPASRAFDAGRLARIDAFLKERYVDAGKLPHAQLLLAHEGEVVHLCSFGPAREGGAAVGEGSLFRIASMTKPVTSLAFMMLVEEARVALDTPVHLVLPELKDVGVYAGGGGVPFATRVAPEPMRMVDLLRHTAGFTYGLQQRTNVDAAYRERKLERWHGGHDLAGFVAALAELPLKFAPGEGWNYSVATDVLGAVVERVSGQHLDAFLADRIFAPLSMNDTFFTVPADKVDRLTDCWAVAPGGMRLLYDRGADSAWSRPPTLFSGGGGLVSTALDYHRFCSMCLGGGTLDGQRLVGRKTIELMTRNHLPGGADLAGLSRSMFSEATNAGAGFGLGFATTIDPVRAMIPGSAGDYYWGGLFSTAFFVDPVERIHMVFMTQLSPSSLYSIRRALKTMIYAALN